MQKRKVDILLSTYNGEEFVEQQLQSICNQTFKDWKLIIRDDGSIDNTLRIISKYIELYPLQISLLDDKKGNLGPSSSFFELLTHTNSDYIMFCDQDDYWQKDKIELTINKMVESEKNHPRKPILVHTDLVIVDKNLNVINQSMWGFQKLDPEKKTLNYLLVQNNITGCTVMINKETLNYIKYVPKKAVMHDWWLGLIVATFGQITYLDKSTILYRQHGKNEVGAKKYGINLIKSALRENIKTKKSIRATIDQSLDFYKNFGPALDKHSKKQLDYYTSLLEKNTLSKVSICLKNRFFKNSLLRTLGYFYFLSILKSEDF